MKATEAYSALLQLKRQAITTDEASTVLGIGKIGAIKALTRLAHDGLVFRIKRGLWAISGRLDPIALGPYLTAPYPSYVSLWTALNRHDMIDQVPRLTYLVSLGRPRLVKTTIGTYSVHRISPPLFGGFQVQGEIQMAEPEKALFDTVYILKASRNRPLRLPEIDLPPGFSVKKVDFWLSKIPSMTLRTRTDRAFRRVLHTSVVAGSGES